MLPQQLFEIGDLPVIGFLVLLEGLLSADNALVLAVMVKHLPAKLQKKALLYGLGGAFVFRFIAIVFAAQIIALWWLQAIGALYLLILPIKHFLLHDPETKPIGNKKIGFWRTVLLVELADIGFAIDSVVAGVAMIKSPDKLWVVYAGAIIGIVILRFAAGALIKLIQKMPALDYLAYVLVGWVGVKLSFMAGHNFVLAWNTSHKVPLNFTIPEMSKHIFWSVLAFIIVTGIAYAYIDSKKNADENENEKEKAEV